MNVFHLSISLIYSVGWGGYQQRCTHIFHFSITKKTLKASNLSSHTRTLVKLYPNKCTQFKGCVVKKAHRHTAAKENNAMLKCLYEEQSMKKKRAYQDKMQIKLDPDKCTLYKGRGMRKVHRHTSAKENNAMQKCLYEEQYLKTWAYGDKMQIKRPCISM